MPQTLSRKLFDRPALIRMLIAFVAVMLTVWAQWLPANSDSYFADEWLRDHFIRARTATTVETRIAVIDIDEASLAAVGPWPWPRERIATLMETALGAYGASAVALDLVFPEPGDAEGDLRLSMLAQHGPVVLAQAFDYVRRAVPLRIGQIGAGAAGAAAADLPPASGFIANHAGLRQAKQVGNIGFEPDNDGTIRRLPMLTSFEGRRYPTLSLALLTCCDGAAAKTGNVTGFKRIPFSRDWSAYTVVAAGDILNGRAPVESLKGRLVLVGSSSLGLTDRVATPLNASTSGLMVHAAMLTTLLDEQAGQAPSRLPGQWIAVLFSMIVAAAAAYVFPRLSALACVAMLASACIAWLLLAFWIAPHDALFSTTGPLASSLFLLAVAVPFDWQVSQRRSVRLLGTLNQYVASAVVDELLRRNLKDPLTPVQRHVTTLIADMEGYTTHVESLPVEEAAQVTRDFLDCLTRPVMARHGTLDKYTGDGLVAFWGAPLPVDDHADLAVEAAVAILAEVHDFNAKREAAGKPPLRVRIGIESGLAMAGDFGTSSRSIYTAVGDSVNVASRLQELGRELPYDIIIGQGTAGAVKRHDLQFLGDVVLRGKEKSTRLFTAGVSAGVTAEIAAAAAPVATGGVPR